MQTVDLPPITPGVVAPEDRDRRREHLFAALTFGVYIIAFLFPLLRDFASRFIIGMDMDIWFPYKWYWIESVKQGDPAFWNPYWVLGGPFLAHPSVGAYSPFNILNFFLPSVVALNVRFLFFYFWAAFGTYLFLRRLGTGWTAGVLSGFAFAFCTFYTARSTSHAGHPYVWWAFSWTPWMLYCLERAITEKRWICVASASVCATFSFFESHPQTTYMGMLLAGFYLLGTALSGRLRMRDTLKIGAGFVALFCLLAACQILPSYEFLKLSSRWNLSYGDSLSDFLKPENLRHFVQPDFMGGLFEGWRGRWGYHEIVGYVGLAPLILFLAGILVPSRNRRYDLFFILAFLFLAISMGDSTPFTKWVHQFFYYGVPGFSMHRSQGRFLGPASFSIACGAGLVLDALIRRYSPGRTPLWAKLLIVLTVLDLWAYGIRYVRPEDSTFYDMKRYPQSNYAAILNDADLIRKIQEDPDRPRILPAHDGHYSLFHKLASIASSDVVYLNTRGITWQYFNTNSFINDLADVKYAHLSSTSDLVPGRWKQIGPNLYENTKAIPHVVLAGGYQSVPGIYQAYDAIREGKVDPLREVAIEGTVPEGLPREPGPAGSGRIVKYTNNSLEVECQADRACFLFISDNYYPGWKAFVDDKETAIYQANGAFRAVVLPGPGSHRVRMEYRPVLAYAGMAVSLFGWSLMALLLWKGRRWNL